MSSGVNSDWSRRLSDGLRRIASAQTPNAVLLASAQAAHELTDADGACVVSKDHSEYSIAGVDGEEVRSLTGGTSLQRLISSVNHAGEAIVQHPPEADLELRSGRQRPAETFIAIPLGSASTYLAVGYFWGTRYSLTPEQQSLLLSLALTTGLALQAQTNDQALHMLRQRQRTQAIELQHRVRNVLSVVRSLIRRCGYASESAEEFASHLEARISALARTQGSFALDGHGGLELEDLVRGEFSANAVRDNQFDIAGPALRLSARATEAIALTLHELTMNALKFGALSEPGGHIDVRWSIDDSSTPPRLQWRWSESGVASIQAQPHRRGFGQELIERVLPYELGAKTAITFTPGGVRCEIDVPLNERTVATHGVKPGDGDWNQDEELT